MDQLVEDKPPIGRVAPRAQRSPASAAGPAPVQRGVPRRRPRRRGLSPLTVRILAVNVLALVILAFGLLYLDRYEQGLTESEFDALEMQGRLIAGALGESATEVSDVGEASLDYSVAQAMVRR